MKRIEGSYVIERESCGEGECVGDEESSGDGQS